MIKINLTRKKKTVILILLNVALTIIANVLSFLLISPLINVGNKFYLVATAVNISFNLLYSTIFNTFQRINHFLSIKDILQTLLIGLLNVGSEALILSPISISYRYVVLANSIATISLLLCYFLWMIIFNKINPTKENYDSKLKKRTLLIGAGSASFQFLKTINSKKSDLEIIGLIDDDPEKQRTYLSNKRVLGTVNDLPTIALEKGIQQIILAIPSLTMIRRQEIIEKIVNANLGVELKVMPPIEDVLTGKLKVTNLREIDINELLSREEVKLDLPMIADNFQGKVVLITGAGGSIGSELVRQVLKFNPQKLILLDHCEYSMYRIYQEVKKIVNDLTEVIPIIADIKNKNRLDQIFRNYQPEIVLHAAAYKHVPLMEVNVVEALQNNVYGTLTLALVAQKNRVRKFIMISTDKAVSPTNVMGATKRIAEMIILGLNKNSATMFSLVRFGNVLGSSGSVIPLFKKQIASGGPVTVTDFRMTRFFMTIPEASRLVLQAASMSCGSEIFILDMGEPVKIYDLAEKMIKLSGKTLSEIPIVEIGIRPGEKLYEELFLNQENKTNKIYDQIFVTRDQDYDLAEIKTFLANLPKDNEPELKEELLLYTQDSVDVRS